MQKKLVDMDDGVNYFNQGGNGEGALPIRETDVSGGQKIYSRSVADYVQEAGVTLLMTEHALVYGLRLEDGSLDGVDALATWEAYEEKLNAFAMDGDYVYLAYEDGLYRLMCLFLIQLFPNFFARFNSIYRRLQQSTAGAFLLTQAAWRTEGQYITGSLWNVGCVFRAGKERGEACV